MLGTTTIFSSSDRLPFARISNHTGVNIQSVWTRVTSMSNWGANRINKTFINGTHIEIELTEYDDFDFMLRTGFSITGGFGYSKIGQKIDPETILDFTVSDRLPYVSITNHTGENIQSIWYRTTSSNPWGTNQSTAPLANNGTVEIEVTRHSSYDFMLRTGITANSGFGYTIFDRQTSTGNQIVFTKDDRLPYISITNNTGVNIQGIWFRVPHTTSWGINLLTASLGNDNTIEIEVSQYRSYDFMLRTGFSTTNGFGYFKLNQITSHDTILNFTISDRHPYISITNNTGVNLNSFWMRNPGDTSWGTNLFNTTLSQGNTIEMEISEYGSYDFMARTLSTIHGGMGYIVSNKAIYSTTNITFLDSDFAISIGDIGPAGGRIFYDKGEYSDGWRYLEASPMDISFFQWSNRGTVVDGTSETVGSGKTNTELIVAALAANGETGRAAQACVSLTFQGYSDWFLPSLDELRLIYDNLYKNDLASFSSLFYWSSTQCDEEKAYVLIFSNLPYAVDFVKNSTAAIRAIRAF